MPKAPRTRANGGAIELTGVIGGGAAKLKKKIRDIERLLKKESLPADIRLNNERALKGLNVELQNAQFNLKTKEIAKKYHMVRFFERKKAVRKLKLARKALEEVTKTEVRKDIKKARKVVKHSEVDVAYVVLFPKTEKYISLYPNASNEEADGSNLKAKAGLQQTDQRRRDFRKEVETLIDEEKLPFSIDDVVSGRATNFDNRPRERAVMQQEIDAPEQKKTEQEADDFFE